MGTSRKLFDKASTTTPVDDTAPASSEEIFDLQISAPRHLISTPRPFKSTTDTTTPASTNGVSIFQISTTPFTSTASSVTCSTSSISTPASTISSSFSHTQANAIRPYKAQAIQHISEQEKNNSAKTSPLPEDCPVSYQEWVSADTEDMIVKEGPTNPAKGYGKVSYAKSWPKVWKVVTAFYKHWLGKGWTVPSKKNGNVTDFKCKVSKHIVSHRKRVLTSDIASSDLVFVQAMPPNGTSNPWYLNLDEFMVHAEMWWKVDELATRELMDPNVNDIVRLFSIAARGENRSDVVRLGIGRNQDHAEMDGPLDAVDSIFYSWQKQFNDPDLTLAAPDRAVNLESYLSIDPNDLSRIQIERDHKFLRSVYFTELKLYNKATKKWQKGTGGGPGYPENFCDWQARDGEHFANYTSAGKGDYLAWIYMLDKGANFVFNTINDPPPASSTMEDGDCTGGGGDSVKRKSKMKNSAEQDFGRTFSDSMDKVGALLTSVLSANNANATNTEKTTTNHVVVRRELKAQESTDTSSGEDDPNALFGDMETALDVITMLEMRRDAMRNCQEDGDFEGRMPKRIKCVEVALDKAYDRLGHFGVIDEAD